MKMLQKILLLFTITSIFNDAYATFVSLKSSEINMRVGPGKEYPIIWTFMKAGLPMFLIAEFDQWIKVKYIDNTEGWIHKNLISKKNTVIVATDYLIMYKYASYSKPIAKIEKNVVMKVIKTEKNWIKVTINGMKGWVEKKYIWGINEHD